MFSDKIYKQLLRENMLFEIILLLCLLLLWAYYAVTKQFNYFKDKGVPFAKPSFPFGSRNTKKIILQQITFNKDISDLAEDEFKGVKVFGYFAFGQPTWVINDEELTKQILIKDFDHFVDRRVLQEGSNTKADAIVNGFLTNLKGDEWKAMRTMMTGVFTSGKLKMMTPHLVKVGEQLEEHIENILSGKSSGDGVDRSNVGVVEVKSMGGLFTLDAIATTGFGIEVNSFLDPNNRFRDNALTLIGSKKSWKSKLSMLRIVMNLLFPGLARLLGISLFPQKPTEFFADIIERTYRHRMSSGERRNDIIDLIVDELNAAGKLKKRKSAEEFESEFEKDAAMEKPEIEIDQKMDKEILLISNALLFFFAGFDTTSTGLTMIAHNLAMHQDVQDKVVEEITDVLGDTDKIRFDDLQKLKYMDMVISESFRFDNFFAVMNQL